MPRIKKKHKRNRVSAEINITPFVDVLLIVLLAFMVTAPMLSAGFDVSLPKSSKNPLPENNFKKISIIVKASGNFIYDKKLLQLSNIANTFKSFNKETTQILIQADKSAKYEYVISLMSALNIQGFKSISLLTEQEN